MRRRQLRKDARKRGKILGEPFDVKISK